MILLDIGNTHTRIAASRGETVELLRTVPTAELRPELIPAGEVAAFRHEGFWQCMDTPREHQLLNDLWRSGDAPWSRSWSRK